MFAHPHCDVADNQICHLCRGAARVNCCMPAKPSWKVVLMATTLDGDQHFCLLLMLHLRTVLLLPLEPCCFYLKRGQGAVRLSSLVHTNCP